MMKRVLPIGMSLMLLASLVACGEALAPIERSPSDETMSAGASSTGEETSLAASSKPDEAGGYAAAEDDAAPVEASDEGETASVEASDTGEAAPVEASDTGEAAPVEASDDGEMAPIEAGLRFGEVCLVPLLESLSAGNALLTVEVLEAPEMPAALAVSFESGTEPMVLLDDGGAWDLVAGDGIYSVAVSHERSEEEPEALCANAADWGFLIEPLDATPDALLSAEEAGSSDFAGNCPPWMNGCIACGGDWRPLYCCSWIFGCWHCGMRCYGCMAYCRIY